MLGTDQHYPSERNELDQNIISGHFCGMAEMLTPVCSIFAMNSESNIQVLNTGRLHAEQHCVGVRQVERRFQSAMGIRSRHSQREPPSHQAEVRTRPLFGTC